MIDFLTCSGELCVDFVVYLLIGFCFYVAVSRFVSVVCFFFFQAEDGIRDLVRSRGLGDVYKRQLHNS